MSLLRDRVSDLLLKVTVSGNVRQNGANQNGANQNNAGKINFGCLLWLGVLLGIGSGALWVINLPIPFMRRAVAEKAPVLLVPSLMSWDKNYRAAIANVEQADQLVNSATSSADVTLGAEKVKTAQEHLNRLPVNALGYRTGPYCDWFDCSWRFTRDEFQNARKQVGRLEAVVFQEQNALTQWNQASAALQQAQAQYNQAPDDTQRQNAIAAWQAALDQIAKIPPQTTAGRSATAQLEAYKRDFSSATGKAANLQTKNTFITAAQGFGSQAAIAAQDPPHTVEQWKNVETLWQSAIAQLERVPTDNEGYGEAQQVLAEYQNNLGVVRAFKDKETQSQQALSRAESLIQNLLRSTPDDPEQVRLNDVAGSLQGIINELDKVQPQTTSYVKAQELRTFADNKLKELQ